MTNSLHLATATGYVTLDPPRPPTDLTASALALPLHKVGMAHAGRKLRLVAQILTFHAPTSLLLLTSSSSPTNPHAPSPTILVNIATPLLAQSPAITDVSGAQDALYSRAPQTAYVAGDKKPQDGGNRWVNRELLSLFRGEWVNVVGWLEGDGERMVKKVKTSASFIKPLPLILEAIHVSNALAPPVDAVYRGDLPSHIRPLPRSVLTEGAVVAEDEEDLLQLEQAMHGESEDTPRPKTRRKNSGLDR